MISTFSSAMVQHLRNQCLNALLPMAQRSAGAPAAAYHAAALSSSAPPPVPPEKQQSQQSSSQASSACSQPNSSAYAAECLAGHRHATWQGSRHLYHAYPVQLLQARCISSTCSSASSTSNTGANTASQQASQHHSSQQQERQQEHSATSHPASISTDAHAAGQQHAADAPSAAPTAQPTSFSTAAHLTDSRSKAPLMSAKYASSADDAYGVQKNWFTGLYKQLNYLSKTGTVPEVKGRQRELFEQVEHEFESLYAKHIDGKGLDAESHRSLLMVCLSIATYRVLSEAIPDTRLVRDIIRTCLGSVMLLILRPLHRFKLWWLSWLLREDMYRQAVNFLPAAVSDMGRGLVASSVTEGPAATTLDVTHCKYYDVLTQEDAPFLLSEFCCHHALLWLSEFRRHGVVVSMDECKAWDDSCCKLRIARPGQEGIRAATAAAAAAPAPATGSPASHAAAAAAPTTSTTTSTTTTTNGSSSTSTKQ